MCRIDVAQEQLDRAQVRTRFKEVGRVGMAQQVGRDAFAKARALSGHDTRFPQHLRRDRFVGTPVVHVPGNSHVLGRLHRQYTRNVSSSVALSGT